MSTKRILVVSRTPNLAQEIEAAAGGDFSVTPHDHPGDLEELVNLEGPFDVLVAGPIFDTRIGLESLRKLRTVFRDLPIIMVMPRPTRSPVPDLIRVGATDLVELPTDRRRLQAALRRALDADRVPVPVFAEENTPEEHALAKVYSVASPSGGCGKTFYSTNLAYFLSRDAGRRVCVLDLDLQFGEVSAALRLKPRYTIIDAIARSDEEDEDLGAYIEDYLVPHPSGFWVLSAPRHPAEADKISPPDVTKVIQALRHHFDYVVLDTSAQLSEVVVTALEQSTALMCMATLDLPSIRNMRVFLETLTRLQIPTERISVTLNKVEPDMGIRVEEADEALFGKVVSVLPYAREVSRSINKGQPVLMSEPRSDISVKLSAGMSDLQEGRRPGDPRERSSKPDRKGSHASKARRRLLMPWRRAA
jgi:pilus assembly protein CpaE